MGVGGSSIKDLHQFSIKIEQGTCIGGEGNSTEDLHQFSNKNWMKNMYQGWKQALERMCINFV